jgi:peptidoglycan/LPS O-acetylase OafA/YrhL
MISIGIRDEFQGHKAETAPGDVALTAAPHQSGPGRDPDATPRADSPHTASAITRSLSAKVLAHLTRETSSGRFIPEMDGLRFVAIGMVVLFHLSGYLIAKSTLHYSSPPRTDWLAQVAQVGFRGVELFFVISGFILGLPFAAHCLRGAPRVRLSKYYLRRLTRLEPPYFFTLLVLFLLALWVQGKTAAALYPHLAASFLYLHNLVYGTSSPVLGVAWSLEIEVQFYLLVPLLTAIFAVRDRWKRRALLLALTVLVLVGQALFLKDSARASLSILAYLQFFLIGFFLADVYLTDWQEAPPHNFYWDVLALAGWPLLLIMLRSPAVTHWLFPYAILLLYCSAFRGVVGNFLFTRPWITAIGGMCYSIYLIHYEVISLVGRLTKRIAFGHVYWVHLLIQLALVGTAIVVVCGLYFVVLEKPCMRRDWPRRLRSRLQRLFAARESILEAGAAD